MFLARLAARVCRRLRLNLDYRLWGSLCGLSSILIRRLIVGKDIPGCFGISSFCILSLLVFTSFLPVMSLFQPTLRFFNILLTFLVKSLFGHIFALLRLLRLSMLIFYDFYRFSVSYIILVLAFEMIGPIFWVGACTGARLHHQILIRVILRLIFHFSCILFELDYDIVHISLLYGGLRTLSTLIFLTASVYIGLMDVPFKILMLALYLISFFFSSWIIFRLKVTLLLGILLNFLLFQYHLI